MPKFYGAIDLVKNELQNAVVQNLGSAPASPTKGQIYFNSSDNVLYWFDGTAWVPAKDTGAGSLTPASGVVAETTFAKASAVGSSLNYAREDHTHGSPTHDDAAHIGVHLNSHAPANANVDMGGQRLVNLAITPVGAGDATSKNYVDSLISGLAWKNPCKAASTGNLSLTGGANPDGVTLFNGDRVLVKNQSDPIQNGIYSYNGSGAWGRVSDFDTGSEYLNAAVFVSEGTTQADTAWVCTTNTGSIGSVAMTFVQFGAGVSYTAGAGLTLTGNVIDVGAGSGIQVNADSIQISPSYFPAGAVKKYSAIIAGNASPEAIIHSLNTFDIHVAVYNGTAPFRAIEVDWEATNANTVTLYYNPAIGSGYRVVVMG